MKKALFSLNINYFVFLSVLLHAGFFLLSLTMSATEQIPQPIGVELQYGEGGIVETVKPEPAPVKVSKVTPTAVSDVSEAAEIPVEERAPEASAPQVASESKKAGSVLGTSDKGALEGREGVANGIEVSAEQRYLYELKKLLERRKRYPVMARKMGQVGRVMMRFTLAQDGSLVASEVLEKAPYEVLNQAAHDLVKSIHGLKPFPNEIQKTSWSITVPIEYVLN